MAAIYSEYNKIKFTNISEQYAVPKKYHAKLSMVHSALIQYVEHNFKNTKKYKQRIVDALNILTYCIFTGEVPPFDWRKDNPLDNIPEYDMDKVQSEIEAYWLTIDCIEWNVKPTIVMPNIPMTEQPSKVAVAPAPSHEATTQPVPAATQTRRQVKSYVKPTNKEDLYIQSPKYPRFDVNSPWLSMEDRGERLVIYKTLPEIPTKQNEISCTTELAKMTDGELLKLFPNCIIHTRAPILYEKIDTLEYDPDLGCIIPVYGYSHAELVDNIIRYPHLYKLKRVVDGEVVNFYEDIEIDGELLSISSVWDSLPESKVIPKQPEFIKEYVVRRYLLEKASGVQHNYPLYGTLGPFLTLFMPPEGYIQRGYDDIEEVARECVSSRISYKRSRNPILKRLNISV